MQENDVIETEVETTQNDVETEESNSNIENEDPNFDEGEGEGSQDNPTESNTEEEGKQSTKGKKSSYYANIRREREAKEKANNQGQDDSYIKGVIAGTGGKNPYTGKEIKDKFDLQEFELMQKLDKDGKDPVNDYLDALKARDRENSKAEQEEMLANERLEQQRNAEFKEFEDAYGVEKLEELSQNNDFLEFADSFKESATIKTIYEIYQSIDSRAQKIANEKYARKISSTGGVGKRQTSTSDKSFMKMSDSEFLEYQRKVVNGEI